MNSEKERRDALEALNKIEREVACGYGFSDEIHAIRRALSAGVPEAVLKLPDAWRADAMGYDKYDDSQNIFAAAINYCADALDRVLAQSEQGRVQAGWKMVPVEPTGRMTEAGSAEVEGPFDSFAGDAMANRIYAAMLAAAPGLTRRTDGSIRE